MIAFLKKYNTALILSSVVLSIMLGIVTPNIFDKISFLGNSFINLLKLFALPLISSALISTIGGMSGELSKLKKVARNMTAYMLISEVIAVSIALLFFNIFKPGSGVSPSLISHGQTIQTGTQNLTLANFISSIIPDNIFESLTKFELLPVVFFSIIFGLSIALCREEGKPALHFFTSIKEVSSKCLSGVMLIAPIGIFSLVGNGIANSYMSGNLTADLFALLKFVLLLFVCLFLHALWQFIAVIIFNKTKPQRLLQESTPVLLTAFGTSSSVATLPTAINAADNLGGDKSTIRFMLPIIASINIGGMMMYEVAAALFFTQILGIELSLTTQILLATTCILGGMAEGGIPESSMVSLVVVFKLVNIPLNAISILLPLDRIIDRIRTMVNIFGNMAGALVVSAILKEDK